MEGSPPGPLSVARIGESDPIWAGLRAVKRLDGPAEAGQDLLRELVRRERGDERGLEPERRPDRQRTAPRPRVVLRWDDRRQADREPAVLLEDQPRQRPG